MAADAGISAEQDLFLKIHLPWHFSPWQLLPEIGGKS